MSRFTTFLMTFLFVLFLVACANAPEPVPTATQIADEPTAIVATAEPAIVDPILQMETGWTKIDPGGDTRCAHNTPFSFWSRPGTTNKLLVYFQGGGGCWNGDTCQVGSDFYDASVSANDAPQGRSGILDFDNPENPFADYHAVYVPSCTGDIYLGSNIQTYETSDGEEIDIYHHGFENLNAALDWTFENVLAPDSVFVTGCSAGSIGSIRAAPHLIHQYPAAEVVQLGDSLGSVLDQPSSIDQIYGSHDTLPAWIPAFANFDPAAFTMAEFYNTVAAAYPDTRFAQYNSELDRVQVRYHVAVGDTAVTFAPTLAGALSEIHAASPNFRSYMADGDVHCIMPRNSFYTREVAGVGFRDWVADLAAGNAVDNVQCAECGVDFE